MTWVGVGVAAVGVATSVVGQQKGANAAKAGQAQANADNRISKAKADAENLVRPHSNALLAAQNGLARWAQSANNNALLDAGAAQHEANAVNALRSADAMSEVSFDDGIRAAEERGAQAAAAASAGMMGNVVDTINMTSSLRRNRAKQAAMTDASMRSFDSRRQAAQIMSQTWRGLDGSVIFDNFDYSSNGARISVGPQQAGSGDALLAGVGGLINSGGMKAVGNFFNTPSASPGGAIGGTGLRVPAQTGTGYSFTLPSSGSGLKLG